MRIIAGEFRGRKILPPETDATRPITDRVKQSLFDILTPVIAGAVIYDCFAGTGSMGLESLSRGARSATFFDMERTAIKRLISNIESLQVRDRSTVIQGDIFRLAKQIRPSERATLIFFDPPYRLCRDKPRELVALANEFASRHITADGKLIFRHDAEDALALPPFIVEDSRTYGSMTLEFLRLPVETVTP